MSCKIFNYPEKLPMSNLPKPVVKLTKHHSTVEVARHKVSVETIQLYSNYGHNENEFHELMWFDSEYAEWVKAHTAKPLTLYRMLDYEWQMYNYVVTATLKPSDITFIKLKWPTAFDTIPL